MGEDLTTPEQTEALRLQNIQIGAAGLKRLEEEKIAELIADAKDKAKYWDEVIGPPERITSMDGLRAAMFLELLARTGIKDTVYRLMNITRRTILNFEKKHPEFTKAMSQARAEYAARVHAKLHDIVFNGYDEVHKDGQGNIIKTIHKISERLIEKAIEAAYPEVYGKKEDGGKGPTVPIQINLYLDKDNDNHQQFTTVVNPEQLEAPRLPASSVAIHDDELAEGEEI